MADANLLEALKKQGPKGCLEQLIIFGRVRCAIERPSILGKTLKTSETGIFAILDVYAVKCNGTDYFKEKGTGNPLSIYFSKGSMIIYIGSSNYVGKHVKVSGSSARYGAKVKQQLGHKSAYDGISALAFARQGDDFVIVPNVVTELGVHDPDIRVAPFEDFVLKALQEDSEFIEYPISLESIIPYEALSSYSELSEMPDTLTKFVASDEKVDISEIKMTLVHHLKSADLSLDYDAFKGEIEEMSRKRKDYRDFLANTLLLMYAKSQAIIEEVEEEQGIEIKSTARQIRSSFIENVVKHSNELVGDSSIKGKVYVDQFLEILLTQAIGFDKDNTDQEEVAKKSVKEIVATLSKAILVDPDCLYQSSIEDCDFVFLESDINFALAVISISLGIPFDDLRNNYRFCNRQTTMNLDIWFFALLNLPYSLGLLGTSLDIVDLDRVYFSYSRVYTEGFDSIESFELRADLVLLLTLESASDKDTLIAKKYFANAKFKYPAKGSRVLRLNYFPLKKDLICLTSEICECEILLSPEHIDYVENMPWHSEERINRLMEEGIVNIIDNSVVLERDLEKDFLTYDILIHKGMQRSGIMEGQVQNAINAFEASCGFPLEELQKEGIKLSMFRAGVLSGCAGSGKTTTSDCISDCIKASLKKYKLIYSTPTGKACRRLAEVVHGVVKTIHSQFGVGLSGDSYLTDVKSKFQPQGKQPVVYLLDEMAMANSSLVYEVVRSLGKEDIIYFLGDIKQLPSIGKGNPFYLMMKFLPCVELGVSKRAAEGSLVNYNTLLINFMSDLTVRELAFNETDFFCRECIDIEIPNMVQRVWRSFMDGTMNGIKYEEEDIQVITGYAKEDYIFSAPSLNKPLQKLLRSKDKLLFRHTDRDFYRNERIIHIKTNSYGMQRYIELPDGTLKGVVTFGMINGESGTLVGIVSSKAVDVVPFRDSDIENMDLYKRDCVDAQGITDLLEVRQSRDDMRDDSLIKDPDTYFVKVKVYDSDLGIDVYALYVARAHRQDDILVLTGSDVGNLDYAYALTTHKMQGSQSKVVILPFGSACNPNFINRNMMNTMVTRSQGIVCLVGTIKGEDSPVTRGRQIPSPIKVNDVLSILSK